MFIVSKGRGWLVVVVAVAVAFLVYHDGESARAEVWGDVKFYAILSALLAVVAFAVRKRTTGAAQAGLGKLLAMRDTFFWLPIWAWSALSGVGVVWKLVVALNFQG